MKKLLGALMVAVLLLAGILLFNLLSQKPLHLQKAANRLPLPANAIEHLQAALRLPTISAGQSDPIDSTAFYQLGVLLQQSYPLIHTKLTKQTFNKYSYLFTWQGSDRSLQPVILMAHQDVVPVEVSTANQWRQPPFSGALVNDTIWGRGACDDKGSVIAIMESVESLLASKFEPKRTLLLVFGHDEEIGGARGAKQIANYLAEKKVNAFLTVDEGGQITTNPSLVTKPLAVVGVQEKGYASYRLTVDLAGGHSSQPKKETAITILANAITQLNQNPMPVRYTPATDALLMNLMRVSPSRITQLALQNRWLMGSLITKQLEKDNQTNAMLRTTMATTMLNAGIKDNVIPTRAEAVINTRLLPGDSPESVRQYLQKTIADERVDISLYQDNHWSATAASNMDGDGFSYVTNAIRNVQDSVVVSPYLVIGATDSRHFRGVSSQVYNFVASSFMEGYHGLNERLPVTEYQKMINFYHHLLVSTLE